MSVRRVGLLLVASCGPTVGNGTSGADGSGTGVSTSGTTTTATESTAVATSTESGSTSTGSTSSESTTTSGGSSDGGEPSVCDPQPEDHAFDLVLDGQAKPWWGEMISHTEDCVVESVASEPGALDLVLSCTSAARPEHAHSLTLGGADVPIVPLAPGADLAIDLWIVGDWCYAGCASIAVRDDAGLVLAATVAEDPAPDDRWWNEPPLPGWFAPLDVAIADDVCEPEPLDDPEPGGSFIDRPACLAEQRVALDVTHEGVTTRTYDGGLADIGDVSRYRVIVERARRHLLTGKCTDIPSAGYELVIARVP